MRRAAIYLTLLLAVALSAHATTRTFGNTGTYATLTAALTAASSGDTLRQVGASTEALGSAYTCANKALVIIGSTSLTTTVTAYKVTFSGTGTLTLIDCELEMALYYGRTTAFTMTRGSLVHPGTGTEVATTGRGQGIYCTSATFTDVDFPACGETSTDYGEILLSGGAGAMAATFDGCTFALDDQCGLENATSGYARFLDCTFTGSTAESSAWIYAVNTCDLDSVAFDGCTFSMPVGSNTGISFTDQKVIRINENTCSKWGPHGLASKNPLFYFAQSTTSSRPKAVTVTDNIVRRTQDTAAGSRSWLNAGDKDTGTRLTMTGNLIDSTYSAELDYILYWPVYGDSSSITDNTAYAGVYYLGCPVVADTLEASIGVGWTFSGNVVDHANWAPTSGPSTVLTWCPSHSTIVDNRLISDQCNHLILLNDDGVASATWRAASKGWGASHNTIEGNYFDHGPITGALSVLVADKGRANIGRVNTMIERGSTSVYSYSWSNSGDSANVYNNDVTTFNPGTGESAVFNDAAWSGIQSTANGFWNNLVRGEADYVFYSSSGNGTGWAEANNCWALQYLTRFDFDGDSMSTTSFTDSTSWRMQWGGRGGLTGMTDSAEGFQAVGISTASPGQPIISRTQPGFRTPVEALTSIRSIGSLKGVTLDFYGVNAQDRANLKIWQFAPHVSQPGTFQAVAGDTLQIRAITR